MDRCRAGPRHDVHPFVVNGSAPVFISGHSLVKKWFTHREMEERRAFVAGRFCCKLLKLRDFL